MAGIIDKHLLPGAVIVTKHEIPRFPPVLIEFAEPVIAVPNRPPPPKAAGIKEPIDWHSFRHSYRTWLDRVEAPLSVHQPLILHAGIQTILNVYGKTPGGAKKDAHSAVVGLLMPISQAAGQSLEQSNGFV